MTKSTSQRHTTTPQKPPSSETPRDWAQAPLRNVPSENLLQRDVFGRNLLHICIISNNTQRLAELLAMPMSKTLIAATDFENGWNVLHYIFFLKRMACLRILLGHLSDSAPNVLGDLLKRKDRCRRDPLSLLANHSRDFFWIPEYINENDQFHLVKRYPAHAPRASHAAECWWTPERGASGAYAFGSNTYGNLGLGSSEDRATPSHVCIDYARDEARDPSRDSTNISAPPRFRSLHVANYHAALVTVSGDVYTCGAAKRGRLGHGSFQNSETFKPVPQLYAVVECVISNGHNLALTKSGRLFSWGSNNYGQLGYESNKSVFGKRGDIYEASPQEIRYFRKSPQQLIGVAVSNVHSLAYTADTIFFWGLNIGQMGVPVEKGEDFMVGHVTHNGTILHQPKSVSMRENIRQVASCDSCTVVVMESNEVIVFHQNQRTKLPKMAPRVDASLHFEVFKPSVMTRPPLIKKVAAKSPENIFLLLDTGDVVHCVFNSASPKASKYQTLWTPFTANVKAVDMAIGADGSLVLCTADGSVFTRASAADMQARRGSSGVIAKRSFSKVQGINRVVRVSCSETFGSFGLLRDDIDPLPYKLQQNDFFKDMEYLSPLVEPDTYRKQDQLLDVDHQMNCYIRPQFVGETPQSEVTDRLFQAYMDRHTAQELLPQTYQAISAEDLNIHNHMLRSCMQRTRFRLDWSQEKYCDGHIICNGIRVGFHHGLFYQRSRFCREIFHGCDEYFVYDSMRGEYMRNSSNTNTNLSSTNSSNTDSTNSSKSNLTNSNSSDTNSSNTNTNLSSTNSSDTNSSNTNTNLSSTNSSNTNSPNSSNTNTNSSNINSSNTNSSNTNSSNNSSNKSSIGSIYFKTDIEPIALLVFVHFMYTNTVLDFWNKSLNSKKEFRIKQHFRNLMTLFRMDSYESDNVFLQQMAQLDQQYGDVLVALADGKTIRCSSFIICRSAFFETILSWEGADSDNTQEKYVSLENVTVDQMNVILRHLQGCNDIHLLSPEKAHISDTDDFVNFVLGMIDIADELLLVQLKRLCELAIQDHITIDNVLVLLSHADGLNASKLFMSCCWYIYHNLELVVFDPYLKDIDTELWRRVEHVLEFLDKCKMPDFVVGEKGEVKWNASSPATVDDFLFDLVHYNETYMSDRKGYSSFSPIFEVSDGDSRRRKSSRKMSKNAQDGLNMCEMRENFQKLEFFDGSLESAVSDDDFELVTRKKSDLRMETSGERQMENHRVLDHKLENHRVLDHKLENHRVSDHKLKNHRVSDHKVKISQNNKILHCSLMENLNTKSEPPKPTPILGQFIHSEKRSTKIKFSPAMKLSQKERKAKIQGQLPQENAKVDLRNPWATPAPSASSSSRAGSSNSAINGNSSDDTALLDLPILGQEPKKSKSSKNPSNSTLEDVTIPSKTAPPIKTLQEIQQEQEFARWWEEECRRVQMEEENLMRIARGEPPKRAQRGRGRGRGRGKQTHI